MKDTNSILKYFQLSIQAEIRSRPPVDFDGNSAFTTVDCKVLKGLSQEQFNGLSNIISESSIYNTKNRTSRMAIGAVLMKLRLGISHETLGVLFGLHDRKVISNMLQSASSALTTHFVPQTPWI